MRVIIRKKNFIYELKILIYFLILFNILTDGKYHMLPNGDLMIINITRIDAQMTYRCRTHHRLTQETLVSPNVGRVQLTGKSIIKYKKLIKYIFSHNKKIINTLAIYIKIFNIIIPIKNSNLIKYLLINLYLKCYLYSRLLETMFN